MNIIAKAHKYPIVDIRKVSGWNKVDSVTVRQYNPSHKKDLVNLGEAISIIRGARHIAINLT